MTRAITETDYSLGDIAGSDRLRTARSNAIKGWLDHAQDYLNTVTGPDSAGGQLREVVLYPALDRMLGTDIASQRVLDAGCGGGIIACRLAGRGADVYGVDVVNDFLIKSRQAWAATVANGSGVTDELIRDSISRFRFSDLTDRIEFADDTFDTVISNLVLMWVPEIETVASEFSRVLKPHGRAIVAILNPWTALAHIDRTNPKNPLLILDRPVGKGEYLRMINRTTGPFLFYNRSEEDYQNAFTNAGFSLGRAEDVKAPEDHPDKARTWYPEFLIMEFQKNAVKQGGNSRIKTTNEGVLLPA